MKILNFGSCNIDYVYSLDHIVKKGETEATDGLSVFPGGKGLNQSIALAKAGCQVFHAGCVGEDGDMLLEVLSDSGVDISNITPVDGKNGHAIIQVSKKGENSIFLYPGSNEKITEAQVDAVLSNFGTGDIILLQNEINLLGYIISRAYEKGMTIILNPSPCSGQVLETDLRKVSYLILNEVEAETVTGEASPEAALSCFARKYPHLHVVLTLGGKGSVYFFGGEIVRQRSFDVTAVDTTAAGDTFTGYFISGMVRGLSAKETMREASCAAAISVSRNGAAPSIPMLSEVLERMGGMTEKKDDSEFETVVRKIEEYMESKIDTVTVGDLAEYLNYSTVYMGTLVKKLTGKSFLELLKEKRLSKAADLIAESDMPVGEIINLVGYRNESFFRKIFMEKYGVTPLKYRKNMRG